MAIPRRRKNVDNKPMPSLGEKPSKPNTKPTVTNKTPEKPVKPKFVPGKHNEYNTEFNQGHIVPRKKPDYDLGNGWAIDSVTGIKYKQLGKAANLKGLTEDSDLNEITAKNDNINFDVRNLNNEADMYLAHLRGQR